MKALTAALICLSCLVWLSCNYEHVVDDFDDVVVTRSKTGKVTGGLEVTWTADNHRNSVRGIPSMDINRRGQVELAAFEPIGKKAAKGTFDLSIMHNDEMSRMINANVIAANVFSQEGRAWFLAEVYFDTKSCEGNDGHQGDDHNGHESEGHESDVTDADEHDGHDAGGDSANADHASGGQCRVGQIIAVMAEDSSTPGAEADAISWKWFMPDAPNLPDISVPEEWPHLCNKTIVSGNLVVH